MKLPQLPIATILDFLKRHIAKELLLVWLGLLIWLSFFLKTNVYDTVVNPKPIDENALATKQEKINLKLYDQITKWIETRTESQDQSVPPDPFHSKVP